MKNISSLSHTVEGKNMTIIPRRTSLMAMVLSLSALSSISISAADVAADTLTVTTKAVINGADPTTLGTNKTTIGGGVIRTVSDIYYGQDKRRSPMRVVYRREL